MTKTKAKKKRQYREVKPLKSVPFEPKHPSKSVSHPPDRIDPAQAMPFRTPEKPEPRGASGDPKERNPTFLLIKNLGPEADERRVRELVGDRVKISSLNIVKNSNNVYVEFENPGEIRRLVREHEKEPLTLRGKKLKMCLVNKLPLDLNRQSKICKAI